jgi:Golgi phosphoprotein 3
MLTITEELFLLALDEERGQVPNSVAMSLRFGLGGALVADLFVEQLIQLENKNRVALVARAHSTDELFEEALEAIRRAENPRKLTHWINLFSTGTKKFQARLGERLVAQGVLTREEKRYLWVTPYAPYPLLDANARYWIKHRLREVALTQQTAGERDVALLSLLRAGNLLDHIFTRDELKLARKKVDQLTRDEQIGQGVLEAIQAVEAATVTATMVAATG